MQGGHGDISFAYVQAWLDDGRKPQPSLKPFAVRYMA